MNNLVKGKATEVPIRQIIGYHSETFQRVKSSYSNMVANLLAAQFTPYGSRRKRFFNLLFGIIGTAFEQS